MENKKVCPMKMSGQNQYALTPYCEEENCAWYCEWDACCALVAIPAEISDQFQNLMQTLS